MNSITFEPEPDIAEWLTELTRITGKTPSDLINLILDPWLRLKTLWATNRLWEDMFLVYLDIVDAFQRVRTSSLGIAVHGIRYYCMG